MNLKLVAFHSKGHIDYMILDELGIIFATGSNARRDRKVYVEEVRWNDEIRKQQVIKKFQQIIKEYGIRDASKI